MQKIKIIELFSGIGAQVAAFKRLKLPYEVVGISEIDKYAIKSYEAINGPTHNYGDITKIPYLDYADLWTYSFPCQDLSIAGKQAGIKEGTRSGLLLHVERLLTDSVIRGDQPKYLLLENVKALVSKKFKPDFDKWLSKLEQLGYNNYWQVLNAKDYGIPQNRERVFVVSIRKDVDTKGYKFSEKIPLLLKLKDLLEPIVDEKYYLSQDKVDKFLQSFETPETSYCLDANYHKGTTIEQYLNKHRRQLVKEISNTIRVGGNSSLDGKHTWDLVQIAAIRGRNPENLSDRTVGAPTEQRLEINQTGCSNTLTTVQKDNVVIQVGNIVDTGNWDNPQRGRIDSPSGCSPALNTVSGGGLEPKIVIGSTQKNAYVGNVNEHSPCLTSAMGTSGGNTPLIVQTSHGYNKGGVYEIAPTLTANGSYSENNFLINELTKIRKLTPLECWRLMGFTDEEFMLAQMTGISNSQLYKQAGNSIVVDVLVGIFRELFNADRF